MDKIKIIFVREYLVRVTSKTFLLSTILTPLGLALIVAITILATTWKEDEKFDILLEDRSGVFLPELEGKRGSLNFITQLPAGIQTEDWLKEDHKRGYLVTDSNTWKVSPPHAEIKSSGNIPLSLKETLEDTLTAAIRKIRLTESGISAAELKRIRENVQLRTLKITDEGTQRSSTGLAAILGYVMGFLIYIFMFTYGMIVMRGVIEEKTNRIVEVIISSVRPFQLMIGKILSIAAVGLTQFTIWIILIVTMSLIAGPLLKSSAPDPASLQQMQMSGMGNPAMAQSQNMMGDEIMAGIEQFDISLIFYFIFYFLGGYLLYGSLFAAVGSAVDQESDAQQLMWPVSIPLIIPMLLLSNILQQPDGSLAVFCSLFPLFSPVCMLVRLASVEVPWYELAASMTLLVLTFLVVIWLAGKIYRTGIFMYGKKPTLKEISRWVFS